MKYFLLLIMLLMTHATIFAQQGLLKVYVQDTKVQAVPYANVLLLDAQQQVIAFAISDDNGRAEIEVQLPTPNLWLTGSLMGYASDTIQIQNGVPPKEVILTMRVSAFELQEVQVKDYRLPYKIDGDTTTYAADKYTQGHERNVEALIKKMPGVEVSKNGQIKYKGKTVSKVLLEDDAIFGSRYAIATKSMRADVVDEIQFIDHYLENQLLKGVEDSDELVMNIKVKEERKKLVFGSADVQGGLPSRYNNQINLFSLLEKHKAVVLGNASKQNNGGFSPYEYFSRASAFDS
ncbi:MAG: carboxypeptidase-like regulatory domain-containing protein, partial [Bacteroidota bacterium]